MARVSKGGGKKPPRKPPLTKVDIRPKEGELSGKVIYLQPRRRRPGESGKRKPYDWRPTFLVALANIPSVTRACRIAGVAMKTVYELRTTDLDFRKAWHGALTSAIEGAECEAWRRGVQGVTDVQIVGGHAIYRKVYSDTLLRDILRAYIDRYKPEGREPPLSPAQLRRMSMEQLQALRLGVPVAIVLAMAARPAIEGPEERDEVIDADSVEVEDEEEFHDPV